MLFLGEISALITAILWSFSSIIFTEASKRIGSQQLNVNRLIVALLFLSITVSILGINNQISYKQVIYLAISGLIGLVFGDGFLFKSFQTIGARLSMLLMSLVPAMTVILGFLFLGETISLIKTIAIAITISGIFIVIYERKENESIIQGLKFSGIWYGLLGALGQAAGLLFAKAAFKLGEIDGFTATFFRILSSTIILVPMMIVIKKYKNPITLYKKDMKALLLTIAGSIFGPFLGITFSLIAIKYVEIGIASTLMALVPIMMLPLVRIVYKEKIPIQAIFGAIIAVLGVVILLNF